MFGVLTPVLGGALIGLAASLLLLSHGKVAGISGVIGGLIQGEGSEWRGPFIIGLIAAAPLGMLLFSAQELEGLFKNSAGRGPLLTGLAGLLVGFGTRLGNGCTSGHGVCGLARGSQRSLAATLTFISAGVLVNYLMLRLL